MENNIPQEAVVLAKEAEEMMVGANRYKITTATEYTGAAEQLKLVKAKAKDLDTTRKNLTQPIDESKKRIMDFFRAPLQFLADAEAAIKKSMISYDNEQARIRREEEARLQALARKEQERLERLAEKRAEKAEVKGDMEKAEEIRESVPVIAVPILADNKVKVAGISMRTIWSGAVVDKMLLIKAVAEGAAHQQPCWM